MLFHRWRAGLDVCMCVFGFLSKGYCTCVWKAYAFLCVTRLHRARNCAFPRVKMRAERSATLKPLILHGNYVDFKGRNLITSHVHLQSWRFFCASRRLRMCSPPFSDCQIETRFVIQRTACYTQQTCLKLSAGYDNLFH